MPPNDWREYENTTRAVIGIGLAAICVLVFTIVVVASEQHPAARRAPPPRYEQRVEARDQANVDAQRSMVWAAWIQLGINALGLIGLGATVVFAGLAWQQAKRGADASLAAANATTEHAKLAREHLERMETPFLRAVPDPKPENAEGWDWLDDTIIRFENCGRSYGIITHATLSIDPVYEISETGFLKPDEHRGRFIGRGAVVPAGGKSLPFHPMLSNTFHNRERMAGEGGYIHGLVRFEDALGQRWVMGFAFLFVPYQGLYIETVHADSEYGSYHQRETILPT